jgi:hypothetical protein
MRSNKILTVMTAAVATAAMALAATPSEAQAPPPPPHRPPLRVTVHKRPNVDPVIERRRRDEYYSLYPLEYGMSPMRNSTLFKNGPSLPFFHDRMPFPTCLDLPGYCQGP